MSQLETAQTLDDLFPEESQPSRTGREEEEPLNEPEESEQKSETLVETRLSEIKDAVAQGPQVAQLLADQDIQEVLRAKQRGEKVRVLGENEYQKSQTPEEPEAPPPDLDELSNKELAQYLVKTIVGELRKDVGKAIEESNQPLRAELSVLKTDREVRDTQSTRKQLDDVKKRYKDVEQYATPMVDVFKTNPGLSVEELYWIAKSRTVGTPPGGGIGPNPESERPAPAAAPPPIKLAKPASPGSSHFKSLLEASDLGRGRKV